MIKKVFFLLALCLSACVYKIDIQQGNILAQKDIDKLRPGLTKNQVVFVLGSPVVDDGFKDDKWVYLYTYKRAKTGETTRKVLKLNFNQDKLVSASGDYEIPEELQSK